MTEQFSPEYIDYICKAKALQALWKRKIGDWGTYEFAGAPVVCLWEWHVCADKGAYPLIWLPTLFQLIRVIEGAGYEWEWKGAMRRDRTRAYTVRAAQEGPEVLDYLDEIDDDLLLAAAQLAVRAVEEK